MTYAFAALVLIAGFIIAPVYYIGELIEKEARCIQHEQKLVRSAPWAQTIPAGKSSITIIHPSKEQMKSVCVKYSDEN
jgi:hypothetical protein